MQVKSRKLLLGFCTGTGCTGTGSAPASALDHDIIPEIRSAPALENDDILREILIRLSPLPSSLLRASLVSKRWRDILSDPSFLRRFCAHHKTTPPLLGFFTTDKGHKAVFTPLLRPPNRIPTHRFSLPHQCRPLLVGAVRHGLVLIHNPLQLEAVVWDPVTGGQLTVPYAPDFRVGCPDYNIRGAVLRTTADDGDGGCFKVVLTRTERSGSGHTMSVFMAVYESATRKWSQTSSTVIPSSLLLSQATVLVRNTLCGFLHWSAGILEFDLDTNTVAVIQKPKNFHSPSKLVCRVVRTQDGGLGLAKLSATIIQLWGRRAHGDADAEWVLQKTVNLDRLVFPLLRAAATSVRKFHFPRIVGYDEDNNVIHVAVNTSVFTVKLETLQCEEVPSSFASQNEEIASWCNLFSRSKRGEALEEAPPMVEKHVKPLKKLLEKPYQRSPY
ncbi:hypothetical protein EJB05_35121, partial [Eragrostis curvula]